MQSRIASAAVLGGAYFIACAASVALTRFDGGVAFLWIANAILTAQLIVLRRRNWALPVIACLIASMSATAALGYGPVLAVPLGIANMAECLIGALLMQRLGRRSATLGSHRWLVRFVLAAGIIAPMIGALGAGLSIALASGEPFTRNALHWYNGHALGSLAFIPIALLVISGEAGRMIRETSGARIIEHALLLVLLVVVTIITFAQDDLPLLYLPMLPVVLATFRGGALSTATSIVVLTLIGGAMTTQGHGPIAAIDAPLGAQLQFLQLYIAATMLTVLPANAELERRAALFRELRESEARYRLVTENSTDIVINVDRTGRLRFVSSSIRQISGHDPDELIGKPLTVLLHADDAANAMASLDRTTDDPRASVVSEYRGRTMSGELRWFETHSRAVTDHRGVVTGVVSAIRDITHRKAYEERLARAAMTDPLTGLLNRRALNDELASRVSGGGGGCVALFDLDHFKRVNDTHGHPVGDEVLRRFATIARASVREQDIIARVGGEEFAVILPEATIEQARLVCDRLREALAETRMRIDDAIVTITISGGVAPYGDGRPVADVLRAADAALYEAKHAGRDRLMLAA